VEANPVWMTDAAYNNMSFREEDDTGKIIIRSRTIGVMTEREGELILHLMTLGNLIELFFLLR
jgi:hypothetical protein